MWTCCCATWFLRAPRPIIAFLDLLMTKQETAATAKVWSAMMATSESFELRYVYKLFSVSAGS